MTNAQRMIRVATVALGATLLCAVPSGAFVKYRSLGAFGPVPAPSNIAVDQSNGNVLVASVGEHLVDEFKHVGLGEYELLHQLTGNEPSPPGSFVFNAREPAPVAVDSVSGAIYVANLASVHGVVDEYNAEGKFLCQLSGVGRGCVSSPTGESTFGELTGVAVDSTGNVYIADYTSEAVDEFTAAGADVGQIKGGGITHPSGVAIDSNGVVYVQNYRSSVMKLTVNASDEVTSSAELDPEKAYDVAVDPATDDVYVDHGSQIAVYDSEGKSLGGFSAGAGEPESEGVAVDGAAHDVYVADRAENDVKTFEAVVVPDATRCEAVAVSRTSATLVAKINPDKTTAEYFFQYGPTASYGFETPKTTLAEGNGGESYVTVEVPITGLTSGIAYHCRLDATNNTGVINEGEDGTFITPPPVTSKPCPPLNLRGTSTALCALINPEGLEASYAFMYGEQTPACSSAVECYFSYEQHTELMSAGSGQAEERFTAPVAGLQPVTTYHYRLFLSNELGSTLEPEAAKPDETFTTPPAEPTVNDQSPFVTGISLHEATLHGTVNPGNGVTTYHFDYGITPAYGASTPEAYTQLNYEDDSGEQLITGLQPGAVYHYRLVAANLSGTTTGPDETFTTLDGTPPTVETGSATQISPGSATIAGIVDPAGESASYEFEVGTSESYGTQLFGAISSREEVTAGLSGLLPETVYHYRLAASSAAGMVRGADRTFTTPGYPITIVQPATPALLPIPVFPKEGPIRLTCKKGFVKKGNKCVKKKHHKPVRKKKHKKK